MQCGPDGPIYSTEKIKREQDDPEGIGSGYISNPPLSDRS